MDGQKMNELMEQTLANHVVLNSILANLCLSDLKTARLVSKQWNKEVNNVLSKRDNCILRIGASRVCSELQKLYDSLPSTSLPLVGISISNDFTENIPPSASCLHSTEFYTELIDILRPLKYLEISWDSSSDSCSLEFIVLLFRGHQKHIEELVLLPYRSVEPIKRLFAEGVMLENLKILRVEGCKFLLWQVVGDYDDLDGSRVTVRNYTQHCLYSALSSAPKLEEIRGILFASLVQVPRQCFHAIREMDCYHDPKIRQAEENLLADFASRPGKLTHLRIWAADDTAATEEHFLMTSARMLGASRQSLRHIRFHAVPFVFTLLNYLRHGLEPLVTVQKLYFNINLPDLTSESRRKIARLMSYIFPKLREVTLMSCPLNEEQYDELLRGNFEDIGDDIGTRAVNSGVSRLMFGDAHGSGFPPSSLSYLSEMFPNVTELKYNSEENEYEGLQSVVNMWTVWPGLKKLSIMGKLSLNGDYDAEFCGIFPEEAEQLRKEPIEVLQRVVIVPVRPAIYYLQDLRQLRMWDAHVPGSRERKSDMLTQVTGWLAFKRMSNLTVRITADESDQGVRSLSHQGFIQLDQVYLDAEEVDEDDRYIYV